MTRYPPASGITQVEIGVDLTFKVKGSGLNLGGIDLTQPVPFSLQIGNDLGETDILFSVK